MLFRGLLAAAAVLALSSSPGAAEELTLELNWFPQADHSPYFFAKEKGWYAAEGIDLSIRSGKGSAASAQKVGAGAAQFGVADLATMLLAKGKGADLVAVMSVYANSPQGFYWLKSSGIKGPKDFPGHKIGNPPGDASRVMWPAFAAAVKIDPKSVSFVNISPQAKVASLKSGTIDITSDFYNSFDTKVKELGDNLGYVLWPEVGLNPYGNSLIVNGRFLRDHKKEVAAFVKVTQRAFAACVAHETPCLKALFSAASGLKEQDQRAQWKRIKELMTDRFTTTVALGWLDADRMKSDYDLVKTYFGIDHPFDVKTAYTTAFLDKSVKMPK
jgi:NitT/TauT family transport system substrate-binding protein